jgi:hypothetical protein
MTVSVAFNGANVNTANALTGWSALKIDGTGGGPGVAAADGSIEGSGAVTTTVSRQFVALYYDVGAGNELDFSGGGANEGQMLYLWANFLAPALLLTRSATPAGGFGVFLESSTPGTSQYHCWAFEGSDTYTGGWKRFVLDPTLSATTSLGTAINTASIRYIGLYADVGGTTARFDNLICDSIDVGTGLTVTGTSTLGLFSELAANEETNRYGVLTSLNDSDTAFQIAGELVLGDVGGVASTITDEDSKVFVAENKYYNGTAVVNSVPASRYGINVVGGTGTQTLDFGQEVGSAGGRNGITLVGNDSYQFNIDFNDGNVESSDWLGCTLENVDGTLSFDASTDKFRGNTLVSCSTVTFVTASTPSECTFVSSSRMTLVGTATISGSAFIESTDTAAIQAESTANLSNCSFTKGANTSHALEMTTAPAATIAWDCTDPGATYVAGTTGTNVTTGTSGNEHIFINPPSAVSTTVTISVSAGAVVPSVRKGTNFTGNVDVLAGQTTVTVTPLVTNSEVRVFSRDGSGNNDVELAGVENSGTSFQFTLTAGTVVNVIVFNTLYEPLDIYNYTVPSANSDLPVNQRFDRNYKT